MYWLIGLITLSVLGLIGVGVYLQLHPVPRPRRWLRGAIGTNVFVFVGGAVKATGVGVPAGTAVLLATTVAAPGAVAACVAVAVLASSVIVRADAVALGVLVDADVDVLVGLLVVEGVVVAAGPAEVTVTTGVCSTLAKVARRSTR